MPIEEHLAILKQGTNAWNEWREANPAKLRPDLSESDLQFERLRGADLSGVDLSCANLRSVDLTEARLNGSKLDGSDLTGARLRKADLFGASLRESVLIDADLREANLKSANLVEADLRLIDLSRTSLVVADFSGANLEAAKLVEADMRAADFRKANLDKADLSGANLGAARFDEAHLNKADLRETDLSEARMCGATLCEANLSRANLRRTDLTGAVLDGSDLTYGTLTEADFKDASLSGCSIYGVSAWNLDLDGARQSSLRISAKDEPVITVDHLEVAQFIYLLSRSDKLRTVISTLGSKGVLIIGRFTEERLEILHSIRDELRKRSDLLPIMFEFKPQESRTTIDTLLTLAHMSRFVVADLTDAKAVVQELTKITDNLRSLPIKLIIHESAEMPSMSDSFLIAESVLKPVYVYRSREKLIEDLETEVIDQANGWATEFERRLAELRQKYVPWQSE